MHVVFLCSSVHPAPRWGVLGRLKQVYSVWTPPWWASFETENLQTFICYLSSNRYLAKSSRRKKRKKQVIEIVWNKSTCHLRGCPGSDSVNRFSCADLRKLIYLQRAAGSSAGAVSPSHHPTLMWPPWSPHPLTCTVMHALTVSEWMIYIPLCCIKILQRLISENKKMSDFSEQVHSDGDWFTAPSVWQKNKSLMVAVTWLEWTKTEEGSWS